MGSRTGSRPLSVSVRTDRRETLGTGRTGTEGTRPRVGYTPRLLCGNPGPGRDEKSSSR